jgi:hypothetical protein
LLFLQEQIKGIIIGFAGVRHPEPRFREWIVGVRFFRARFPQLAGATEMLRGCSKDCTAGAL